MEFFRRPSGWIEIICGCMFSGKTEELLRRVRRAKISKQPTYLFKPQLDTRFGLNQVVSHSKSGLDAIPVVNSEELESYLHQFCEPLKGNLVIAIDEVQFFDKGLIDLITALANKGNRIICAGLDRDYLGRPFGIMPELLCLAEMVTKEHAICIGCGSPASFSHRFTEDKNTVSLGAEDSYQALCRKCFIAYHPHEQKSKWLNNSTESISH